jgi:hypothetical protein
MSEVTVETVEITDLGAQARGNRVFGVIIGESIHLSFECAPKDYDASVTFCLIGIMEGLRFTGNTGAVILPNNCRLYTTGVEALALDGPGGAPPEIFPDWGSALAAARMLTP